MNGSQENWAVGRVIMPINPKVVGKTFDADPVEITRGACMFFALAVGDRNDVYLDERRPCGIIAPPMFAAVYGRTPTAQILRDKDIDIEYDRVLHFSQAFHWQVVVRPGDIISTRAMVTGVSGLETGELLEFETVSTNQNGEIAVKGEWAYLVRNPDVPGRQRSLDRTVTVEEQMFASRLHIPKEQSFLYAEASTDRNPLHVNAAAAAARGFRDVIVHGLCTLSLCHRAVSEALCKEDPTRIKTLFSRFSRPVFPGSSMIFRGKKIEADASSKLVRITATDDSGEDVLKDAYCVMK
jgi:acyl dehydratase